jgi:hypothetical protein
MFGPGSGSDAEGELRIAFASGNDVLSKSGESVPDTSDFILKVSDADGKVIYHGSYGDSPESIMVKSGSYIVKAVSGNFDKPAFSSPQFGDEQCVVVPSGGVADVRLLCRQMNCGVRLDVDSGFLTAFPDGVLFLKSSQGKLMYGYSEKRTAYFSPGNVSLLLNSGGKDKVLMTRNMEAQQILVLRVSVAASSETAEAERISIAVDTSRIWLSDSFVIGGDGGKGSGAKDALTVSQAMSAVGEEDVWVSGYIVGGDLTSSSASFETPFSSRTCLLLGPRSSTRERASCISVQLPAGDVREALNLADNPDLLGKKVSIRGDIVSSYYGLIGLKNCTEYVR